MLQHQMRNPQPRQQVNVPVRVDQVQLGQDAAHVARQRGQHLGRVGHRHQTDVVLRVRTDLRQTHQVHAVLLCVQSGREVIAVALVIAVVEAQHRTFQDHFAVGRLETVSEIIYAGFLRLS